MKTTIAIPCIHYHIHFLERTLKGIVSGTELPDKVVIVISYVTTQGQRKQIQKLRNKFGKRLNLTIIEVRQFLLHSEARNYLIKYLDPGLILFHDADDVQHPQRLEIVKYFFNKHDIVHLCHGWKKMGRALPNTIDINKIKVFTCQNIIDGYNQFGWKPRAFGALFMTTHSGACCIKREVLEEFSWEGVAPGEDSRFCFRVLKKFKKTILIDVPLYSYSLREFRK